MAKRKNEHQSLQDALQEFISTNKLDKGIEKIEVKSLWKDLMGNGVQSYTTAVELRGSTLYVSLSSSVLRQELSYGKTKIITMLNEALEKEVIKTLVL